MTTSLRHDVRAIAGLFRISDRFMSAAIYGSGHINDTYCAVYERDGARVRYIHQRINHDVFKNPPAVMENISRVTAHLRDKLAEEQIHRALMLVPTKDGQSYYHDAQGNYWRTYIFIEGAHARDVAETPEQAYQAARAFGRFQQQLADLPAPRLIETIPDFHNTPKRFVAFEQAVETDPCNRAATAKAEIEFAQRRKAMTGVLINAGLPERITHNDTKFNNVLLDDVSGEPICVTDLDTVMPGLALYDFGDIMRTTTCTAPEDERDLSKVGMAMPMFEAAVRGYLSSAAAFLTPVETRFLTVSGKLITFEIGLRFLTDYLLGDHYFKIHRERHNLDRCRAQFRLVESIEQQQELAEKFVQKCLKTN